MLTRLLATTSLLLLTACASTMDGKNQTVSVATNPTIGASCEMKNDKGTWYVPVTPGSVTVNRSAQDLIVTCKKDNLHGSANVVSYVKDAAFGNILAGGLIGVMVDRSNGSAFDYPNMINVALSTKGESITIEQPKKEEDANQKSDFPQ